MLKVVTLLGFWFALCFLIKASMSASVIFPKTIDEPSFCKLTNKPQNKAKSIGLLNLVMIFVDYPDAIATQSPDEIFKMCSPSNENWFNRTSYGRLKLKITPYLKWIRLAKLASKYGDVRETYASHQAFIADALNAASQQSFNISFADIVFVVSNPKATAVSRSATFNGVPGYGVTIKGKEFLNVFTSGADFGYFGGQTLTHELGHSIGLPDLYAYSSIGHGYVGHWSIMGWIKGEGPEYFGWERWVMGWLLDSQVVCIPTTRPPLSVTSLNLTISSLEINNAQIKMIMMKLNESQVLVVESRRAIGEDIKITNTGLLVYLVNESAGSGNGVIQVVPINTNDQEKLSTILSKVGQSLTYKGYTIQLIKKSADSDTVNIKF